MKRTPLRRYASLKSRHPIRQRARKLRNRGKHSDPKYLAWLRARPCRVPGCRHPSEAHHLRHDENGAAIGGQVKDDRRAISLCHWHHIERLHRAPHLLRLELAVDDIREWQDDRLAEQRAEYLGAIGTERIPSDFPDCPAP